MAVKPKAKKVVALRRKGMSFSEIGRRLGFSKQHAQKLHRRVMEEGV